ncbi:MAG: hemerythrin domain-containing protein [Thermaerobacter sp.]|nr:hemerythrin domain-containing protein [Thermaerobacter sp.]
MRYAAAVGEAPEGGCVAWSASFPELVGRGLTQQAALDDLARRAGSQDPVPEVPMRLTILESPAAGEPGLPAPLDLLSREHRVVEGLLERLLDERGDAARAALAFLQPLLERHFAAEEGFWMAELRRELTARGGPLTPLKVVQADHRAIRHLLAEVGEPGLSEPLAVERAQLLAEVVRRHAAKEDHLLFPLTAALLSPEVLSRMDRNLRTAGEGAK